MRQTNRATEFSKDLKKALESLTVNGVDHWEKNWSVLGDRETVDVVGLRGHKPIVLIEAELLREDPVSNVVKVWQWTSEKKLPQEIILLQAFSGAYSRRKRPRKERAVFLSKYFSQCCPSTKYEAIDFPYNPRPGGKVGGGARQNQARELATRISEALKKYAL